MSAAAPWSVKGIEPRAREIAKDLARRSGMTLGEWPSEMISENSEAELGADLRVALGRHDTLARQQRDRIARQKPDEGEGNDRDADKGRDQDGEPSQEKAKHV